MEFDYYTWPPPLHHPSPQLGSPRHTEIPSPVPPRQWDSVQEEIFHAQKSSVFSAQSSSCPHSCVWLNMYWLVWAPNRKDSTSLPDASLPPLPIIKKQIHTHLFTACWYFNHQHLSTWSLPRWPLLYAWSLHKRLFCQFFSWRDSRLLKVSDWRWVQVGTWRIVRRTVGRILWDLFICHWLILLLFILRVVVEV